MDTIRRMWSSWIAPDHLSEAARATVRRDLVQGAAAVAIRDFWLPDPFQQLAAALDALDWERMHILRDGPVAVRAVDPPDFDAAAPHIRFSRHDRAVGLNAAIDRTGHIPPTAQQVLRFFFAFAIVTPALASWVSDLLGLTGVRATSMEFSRYSAGDFIAEHTDVSGTRVCNVVSYFDHGSSSDTGGGLVVRDAGGVVTTFMPAFNSMVLLPISEAHSHWVLPWVGPRGRRTVSIAFSRGT